MSLDLTAGPRAGMIDRPVTGVEAVAGVRARRRATALAVHRDVRRLTGVLAEPITAVRRAALVQHVDYLAARLDEVEADVEVDVAAADRRTGGRTATLAGLVEAAGHWRAEPSGRADLLTAARAVLPALSVTVEDEGALDDEGVVDDEGQPGSEPSAVLARSSGDWSPTRLAYRTFWLLDELPADLVEPLTRELSDLRLWLLRNLFSGGYNRRSHLMWVGGGSGPAL